MARLIAILKRFPDLPGGKLEFTENRIATKKDTFSNVELTDLNDNPVSLDGEGFVRQPIFGEGLYSVNLFDKDGVFVIGYDDVSPEGSTGTGAFANWSGSIDYTVPVYVTGSDSNIYKAIAPSKDADPTTNDGSIWIKIEFISFYSEFVTYPLGQKVKVASNDVYVSLVNSNINNEPVADGGVNWELENPLQDWVTGRTYKVGDKVLGSDNRIHKAVLSQKGNDPVGDTGTNWLPTEGVVVKPINVSPADLAIDITRTPTLTTDAYAVTGSNAAQEYSKYFIYDDAIKSNLIYESGISTDLTSHKITITLEAATTFYWDVIKVGFRTDPSEFSDLTSFTTIINLSESYDSVFFTGTGAALSVITTVDLNVNSGSVWINNNDTATAMRIMDTGRGVGNAIIGNGVDFNEVSEVQGLTAFNANGFSVGTDAAYNGNTNNIYSVTFKKQTGLFDSFVFTGTELNTTKAHNLNIEVGMMAFFQLTGLIPAPVATSHCWIKGMSSTQTSKFAKGPVSGGNATVWNSTLPTSSVISLGTSEAVNGLARTFQAYIWAHNPAAGIFCGSYIGTGVAGNKTVTDFDVDDLLVTDNGAGTGWFLFNQALGTSSHIFMDGNSQTAIGGLDSFDSDGFTVGGTANDLGVTYYFKAMKKSS